MTQMAADGGRNGRGVMSETTVATSLGAEPLYEILFPIWVICDICGFLLSRGI